MVRILPLISLLALKNMDNYYIMSKIRVIKISAEVLININRKNIFMSFMLSIIIPVYNSENTIDEVVGRLLRELDEKVSYEIILVNDGSTDSSYSRCLKLAQSYNSIKLVNLSRNFGQHNAMIAGLKFIQGEVAVFMDDDLQTPPEEIWKLIKKLDEGYDIIYANYINKKHNIFRKFGSTINAVMANILLKKPRNLKTSSYFVIRKYLATEILEYQGPYPYLPGLVLRITSNIGVVNIEHKKRAHGKSNYSFIKLLRLWFNGFTNFSVKPLRIALFFGLLCAAAGFIIALILLIRKMLDSVLVTGWTSTIVAILFFSGIQLISVGLIGEYVGRIFMSQNKQPQYVIRDTININSDSEH